MKEIIALLVVMLAFGLHANAQDKTVKPVPRASLSAEKQEILKQAAIKDANALAEVVTLKGSEKDTYVSLFENKHRQYAQNLSAERKAHVAQTIEAKLKAGLSADDIKKLEAKPELMKRLTGPAQ